MWVKYNYVTLSGNDIHDNEASGNGGGVYLYSAHVTVTGNRIATNTAVLRDGGGVYSRYGGLTLSGNSILNNISDDGGGGVSVDSSDDISIDNNVIAANHIGSGGSGAGLCVSGDSQARLRHNTVASNGGGDGSGIYMDAAIAVVSDTIVVEQHVGVATSASGVITMEATLWGNGSWANDTD